MELRTLRLPAASIRGPLRRVVRALGALMAATTLVEAQAAAQIATGPLDTTEVVVDVGDVVSLARAAQARFERRRIRLLPLSYEPFGGACDEVVGRLCTTYDEGEWFPVPEVPELAGLRAALIAELDSLQRLVPREPWIAGQRVWYRAEIGSWDDALRVARACRAERRWWCDALVGFALHGLERYREAERAFERALLRMDSERARRWRRPQWPIDPDARALLDGDGDDDDAERRRHRLRRLWVLADPLYLVEGNDRLTAHYARWTVSELRRRARNPFRLSWGDDLTELTIRHGWEIGWERTPARNFGSVDQVVGHKHPEGRDYMPSGAVLDDPASAAERDLRADRHRPRSLYAPAYAPVLLPMDGQLAVFPRRIGMALVATHFLPPDTTLHASHGHPLPWLAPGAQADMADRHGLYAVPVQTGVVRRARSVGMADGVSLLTVPEADYVVSAESWSPRRRRAGRMRMGIRARSAPDDVATLSDIVILRPTTDPPESLEEALDLLLPRPRIRPGQTFAIGWEVAGLGFRREGMRFEVSVRRVDRGLLDRVGGWLGLAGAAQPLALSWEEPGPERPGPVFRFLSLDLPVLDEGRYEIRLALHTEGRSETVATRAFTVARG